MDKKDVVYIHTHTHTHIHTMEYYSAMKKNEIMPFVTWLDLADIMLSELSQTGKDTPCMILYVESKQNRTQTKLTGGWLPQAGVGRWARWTEAQKARTRSSKFSPGGNMQRVSRSRKLVREQILQVPITKETSCNCVWWWTLTRLIVTIILQHVQILNHYVVHLKLMSLYLTKQINKPKANIPVQKISMCFIQTPVAILHHLFYLLCMCVLLSFVSCKTRAPFLLNINIS